MPIFPPIKIPPRRKARSGYGLVLMLVFLMSTMLIAVLANRISINYSLPIALKSYQDYTMANTMTSTAFYKVKKDILSKLNAGTTVTTSYTYGPQNMSVPNDPNSLNGATSVVGTYSAKILYARGISYMVKVTATYGSSTVSKVQLMMLSVSNPTQYEFKGQSSAGYQFASVYPAGDVNGDGIEDFLAAPSVNHTTSAPGQVYLIFGRSSGTWSTLMTPVNNEFSTSPANSNANLANGFIHFIGRTNGDALGSAWNSYGAFGPCGRTHTTGLISAGDVNGDGYDDFLLGAPGFFTSSSSGSYSTTGEAYLVLGRSTAAWNSLAASNGDVPLNSTTTTRANGIYHFIGEGSSEAAIVGVSVIGVGDIDGDGTSDFGIGSNSDVYIIFGRPQTAWNSIIPASGSADFNLSNATLANSMIRIQGDTLPTAGGSWTNFGLALVPLGDVNGDGVDDFMVGAPWGNSTYTGEAVLLFGRSRTTSGTFPSWNSLTASNGNFSLNSSSNQTKANGIITFIGRGWSSHQDGFGIYISPGADANGDGYNDILIDAPQGNSGYGESFLIFGRPWSSSVPGGYTGSLPYWDTMVSNTNGSFTLNTSNVSMSNGIVHFLPGVNAANEGWTWSMGGADFTGDLNGDGISDLVFQDSAATTAHFMLGQTVSGWNSLIPSNGDFQLTPGNASFNRSNGFYDFSYPAGWGWGGMGVGDVNGDGKPDMILMSGNYNSNDGAVYLIEGRTASQWNSYVPSTGVVILSNYFP